MVRAGAEGLLLAGDGVSGTLAVVATLASGWWDEVDRSERWQRGIFYSLCAAYSLVSLVSLLQLIRLQLRVQQMTIQKIFHFMNFVVNGLRAVLFGLYHGVFLIRPKALEMVVLDLPGLLFFSTYTLLILFWANIYHQVRGLPSTSLRPAYLIINGAIYLIQVGIWVYVLMYPGSTSLEVAKLFFAVISFVAALGFGIYGGRLFVLLRNSAVETRSLQKKVIEVGCVTAICCTCFLIRCITVAISAVHEQADLDVLGHPLLNLIYYMLVEIVPSALVLFILWKLPARRSRHHHPIS